MVKISSKVNSILLVVLIILIIYIVIELQNIKKIVSSNKSNINSNINNLIPNNTNNNTNNHELLKSIINNSNEKQTKDIIYNIGHRFYNNIVAKCKKDKLKKNDYFTKDKSNVDINLNDDSTRQMYWDYNFLTKGEEIVNFSTKSP